MLSCRQMHDGRSRRRQPRILYLNDSLPVNEEIVSACHFLAYVEQQRIVASLCHVDSGFIEVTLAHLPTITLCRGDIHHLTGTLSLSPFQRDAEVARVELRQTVVVPKDAITFVRQEHRNGYLSIHLCEPPRKASYIAIAILKLSQSI